MRRLTCCILLFVLLAASVCQGAEAKFDAAARAKAVGPIVDEETAVVAHVDLSRMSPNLLIEFLSGILPDTLVEIRESQDQLQGFRDAILRVGVKDVYFTITPGVLYRGPTLDRMSWAIGVPSTDQEKGVLAALGLPKNWGEHVVNRALVIPGTRGEVLPPVERPELVAAFDAAGDTAAQFILILPTDTQRVVGELMPELPKELGGGPSNVLTRGISWAAAGIDLSPKKIVHGVIKSENAQAAEALRAKLIDMAHAIGQQPQIRQWWPDIDEAIPLLTPRVEGDRLILVLDEKNENVLKRPIERAQQQVSRLTDTNNLKQIGLAMCIHHDSNRCLPLPASRGPDGKPLLSWRVAILPFLDQNDLYKQFHLDEPWDSQHNRTLIDKMPAVYRLPISKNKEKGLTNYLLPVGNGAVFTADRPTYYKDISDGTAHTIMVVEVDDEHAVTWTKPDDWAFDPNDPAKELGRFFDGGLNTTFCDGSVHFLPALKDARDLPRLRAMFTRAAGDPYDPW